MKQLLQSFRTGELTIADVPPPALRRRGVLIRTAASLISAGTERTAVEFAKKNLVQKATSRPDLVQQVMDKVRREGLLSTIETVRNRLDHPLPLGYSSAGIVLEGGAEAPGFHPGDRIDCAGGGFASHAEVAFIPRNLAVPIAENVSWDAAAFVTIGAIAMQGVRQAGATIGSRVAVIGLGLLGQISLQILKASGCRTFGIDLNTTRVELAKSLGADEAVSNDSAVAAGAVFTGGRGFDAILITADTRDSGPLALAGELARDRAVVVAVGAIGMEIPRKPFYEKELDLRLSRSYGPGRYDASYEEQGNDYPYGYVRWTEQRNMQAVAELMADGSLKVEPLITHRFPISDAQRAYEVITGDAGEPFMGVVLTYPERPQQEREKSNAAVASATASSGAKIDRIRLGLIGAGQFAVSTLLPALKNLPQVELTAVSSAQGVSARAAADRFGIRECTTDVDAVLSNSTVNTVAILTRHSSHARLTCAALESGKNVFVEKPLALTPEELEAVGVSYRLAGENAGRAPSLTVGFNRRFAPLIKKLKESLSDIREPLLMQYRSNAGAIPASHWIQDPAEGGGRLLGEACHFIDLLLFLTGSEAISVFTRSVSDAGQYCQDNFVVTIECANGSVGTVLYAANGNRSFPKESLEVFGGGLAARLDDFRELTIHSGSKRTHIRSRLSADKGHRALWEALALHLTGTAPPPMTWEEIEASTHATLAAYRSLLTGKPVIIEGAGK